MDLSLYAVLIIHSRLSSFAFSKFFAKFHNFKKDQKVTSAICSNFYQSIGLVLYHERTKVLITAVIRTLASGKHVYHVLRAEL